MPFLNYTHQCTNPACLFKNQQYCKPCTTSTPYAPPSETLLPPGTPDPSACEPRPEMPKPQFSCTGSGSIVTFGNLSGYGVYHNDLGVYYSADAYPPTVSSASSCYSWLDNWDPPNRSQDTLQMAADEVSSNGVIHE